LSQEAQFALRFGPLIANCNATTLGEGRGAHNNAIAVCSHMIDNYGLEDNHTRMEEEVLDFLRMEEPY